MLYTTSPASTIQEAQHREDDEPTNSIHTKHQGIQTSVYAPKFRSDFLDEILLYSAVKAFLPGES